MAEQHLVLEEDGTSALLAENGTDALLLEEVVQLGVDAGVYTIDGFDVTAATVILPTDNAFRPRGSLGTFQEYDFSNYYADVHPSSDVPAGDLVLVFVAWTSHYFFGPDGVDLSECSCTDDAGNLYMELFSGYLSNSSASTYAAIFMSQLRRRLRTSNTITLKHYGPGGKAISLFQVGIAEDKRWAFLRPSTNAGGSTGGASDPSAISISGFDPTLDTLVAHVLAQMGPGTDTFTEDADYTAIDAVGTTGHGTGGGAPPTSDVTVFGGVRAIDAGTTSDSVDADTSTDRQWGQAVVAVQAFVADEDYSEFPNTPLIDDFNRANEDPNSGSGLWQAVASGNPGFGTAATRVVSNKAAMSASGTGSGSQYVAGSQTTDENQGEAEVWGTIATIGDAILYMLASGDGGSSTFGGSGIGYRDSAMRALNQDTRGIVAALAWPLCSFNGDLPAAAGSILWGKRSDGVKVGLQQLYPWINHVWIDLGDGWEWVAAVVVTTPNLNYSGQFGIGFEGDVATRLDDFGGGLLERDFGQIMRRWPPRARPILPT